MSDLTWEDIGNEIRDNYLRDGGPENVRFREVQWEVWLAEVERAAAEKAWGRCVGEMPINPDWKNFYGDNNPYRTEAYRREGGEK